MVFTKVIVKQSKIGANHSDKPDATMEQKSLKDHRDKI